MINLERLQNHLSRPTALPLYQRLREGINHQIADGTLKPGEALPSERVLHEQLGLSRATIRQALRVLIDTGQVQSVPGTGNFVLGLQQIGDEAHSVDVDTETNDHLVGIIVSQPGFYLYYAQLGFVFSHLMHEAGYRVDMAVHDEQKDSFNNILKNMLSHGITAVAINPPNQFGMSSVVDELQAQGVKICLIGRRAYMNRSLDFVGADNFLIGYEATRHLIQLGHTHIAYTGLLYFSTGFERAMGYVQAMREASLRPRVFRSSSQINPDQMIPIEQLEPYIDPDPTMMSLWAALANREVTGVACFNDETAARVQKELRNLNLSVPRDVSLIGVDNMPISQFFDVPLTTYALPGDDVAREAANLLLRRMRGEDMPPQEILLPSRLVQRLSTAPPREGLPQNLSLRSVR